MESFSNRIQERPLHSPSITEAIDCESSVDKALVMIDTLKGTSQLDVDPKHLQGVIENLQYAKKMLTQHIIEPQQNINDRFRLYTGSITQNKELWGEVGALYMAVWGYLRRKHAQENQI